MHWYEDPQTPQDHFPLLDSVLRADGRPVCTAGVGGDSHMTEDRAEIGREISGEVQDTLRWLSGGELSPEQFRRTVMHLEQRKLERFGMKLSSFVSPDRIVHFTLTFADNDEFCASFEVNPMTGKMGVESAGPGFPAHFRQRCSVARGLGAAN
jgi:hypothetical protein